MIERALSWLGVRSRWWLAAFSIAALALPWLSTLLRPALPAFVVLLLGLAIARIDLRDLATRLADPRHLVRLLAITVVLIPGTVAVVYLIVVAFGIGAPASIMLIIYAAAPPISAAAAFCFLLGFDAMLALEVTVVATLVTPLIGPAVFAFVALEPLQVPADILFVRLLAIVIGGLILGVVVRRLLGAAWIAGNEPAFDGLVTISMGLFIIPLFESIGGTIVAHPVLALGTLVLAVALNLGTNFLVASALSRRMDRPTAGALGFMSGNRNLAIYLAAMPTDPLTALFVALYQFPMFFTPLIWSRWRRG